jgi:hypothetical protein
MLSNNGGRPMTKDNDNNIAIPVDAIAKFLKAYGGDGHSIIKTQAVIGYGFSDEFVGRFSRKIQSGNDYKSALFDNDGKAVEALTGVPALEFAYGIAADIGADTTKAGQKFGRGSQAGCLSVAIADKLKEL